MEENFRRIVGGSIECVLFATDNTWISDSSKVDAKFVMIVLTEELVEDFTHAINGLWLKDDIIRSLVFLECISAKHCN